MLTNPRAVATAGADARLGPKTLTALPRVPIRSLFGVADHGMTTHLQERPARAGLP